MIEDEKFDQIYPARIRKLSSLQWTPVRIAEQAARLLVTAPGARVLDIGRGAGKFCRVAAALSEAHFTGIEQRADLVAAARAAAETLRLSNVEIIHGNILDISFANNDAFYLCNPFEENMFRGHRIDSAVPLSPELFERYIRHVAAQLGARPLGTRVVTYSGYADEIPACYDCQRTFFHDDLKLWVKRREYDPVLDGLALGASRSHRGTAGWVPPRRRA
ncbi:MAG: methyltransferase domain-containing protein [Chthoniobacterales bacterium]|nr:methyltransferase domain-containing protein [Chthoniobacterales bacterium]